MKIVLLLSLAVLFSSCVYSGPSIKLSAGFMGAEVGVAIGERATEIVSEQVKQIPSDSKNVKSLRSK